ncbi:MAG: DUF5615 family PIN-like protein [Steroidobacteraceae bacterium]
MLLHGNALSPAVAHGLTQAGHDAKRVRDWNTRASPDPAVLAKREGRVLIRADTDFGTLLSLRRETKPSVICRVTGGRTAPSRSRSAARECRHRIGMRGLPGARPDRQVGKGSDIFKWGSPASRWRLAPDAATLAGNGRARVTPRARSLARVPPLEICPAVLSFLPAQAAH